MKILVSCLVMVLSLTVIVSAIGKTVVIEKPKVQLALLLDTSNSMDGLIDQAKTQLWKVVNEFATAKQKGVRPELEVALYEYGKSSLNKETGWVRQILPLTDDLDKVSQELFALKTNGGNEYCGRVIKNATENLKWSDRNSDLKMVFIAGNEPFDQGDIDYTKSCKAAITKSIVINTIFCGSNQEGINTKWKHGSLLSDGSYMNIDQNAKLVHINAPQDKKIAELGMKLNKTYIPFGSIGKKRAKMQMKQDLNAKSTGVGSYMQRTISKSTAYYKNSSWDLVDAESDSSIKVEELKEEVLPDNMKKMTIEERKIYVETKKIERDTIQKQILDLNNARKKFVADERKKMSGEKSTFDSAIIKVIHEQGLKKNFTFK